MGKGRDEGISRYVSIQNPVLNVGYSSLQLSSMRILPMNEKNVWKNNFFNAVKTAEIFKIHVVLYQQSTN
ncbi:MAG: hypothetical protein JNJ85_10170 [Candidatus Kapabacteria bacterium]|nr:hypothetical protein [Candidatus Kapabacteria bacterium]